PPRWWGSLRRLGSGLRPRHSPPSGNKGATWAGSLLHPLRSLGEHALSGYLKLASSWRTYDLYHEPNYIPLPSSLPTVATVHDLSVLLPPQWHPADRVAFYERHFEAGLRRCGHLLAVSEFTRQEMIRELSIPPERITCTYNGVRPDLRPLPAEETAATT